MKPYKIITTEIADYGKGILNNVFVRYISTADSVFSLFLRSLSHRQNDNTEDFRGNLDFIIYDRNPKHIEIFKHLLEWDGRFNYEGRPPVEEKDFDAFNDFINSVKQKLNFTEYEFQRKRTLALLARSAFNDIQLSWDVYKNSKFKFHHIDVIKDKAKFIDMINILPGLRQRKAQFVNFNVSPLEYSTVEYQDSVNDILHAIWIKNITEYTSVVELADANNNLIENYAGVVYAQLNPTFCILPWNHIQYKPTGQSKLCCRYDNVNENTVYHRLVDKKETDLEDNFVRLKTEHDRLSIQKSTMENSFYSNYWSTARQYTIENKPIVGCHKCYREEQGSKGDVQISMRLGSSLLYNDGYLHKKPKFDQPKIEFLEVGFGNYCNLACLSCNSTLSTTWHDDENKFNDLVQVNSMRREVFKKLDNIKFVPNEATLRTLNLIKFTGGEPMINPEFTNFINLVCDQGTPENISLEIYTNCSYVPSPKLVENLTRFKAVQLNLSIDAYGKANDYIRYGSKWYGDTKQTVSNAIDYWLEQGRLHKNINVIMSSTLSVLNILEIKPLMTWWIKKFKDSGNKIVVTRRTLLPTEYDGFYKIQPAHDPSYLNINILPKEYYQDVLEWAIKYRTDFLNDYPELGGVPECIRASVIKLEQVINKTTGNKQEARNFLHYLETMDKVRGNSAENSIPELLTRVKDYLSKE